MEKLQENVVRIPMAEPSSTAVLEADAAKVTTTESDLQIVPPQAKNEPSAREVNFLVVDNGDIVDLVENPDDPTQTLLAISHEGHVHFAELETVITFHLACSSDDAWGLLEITELRNLGEPN